MDKSQYDGRRVKLEKGHPHAGETGTIIGSDRTIAGYGLIVEMDNCQHGTESCFVFSAKDFRAIS